MPSDNVLHLNAPEWRRTVRTPRFATPRPGGLPMSRRDFIRRSAITAGAAAAMSVPTVAAAKPTKKSSAPTPSVAIVGAGLAGLNAARVLKDAGIIADVYEASQWVGGRCWSETQSSGLVYDLGGSFINTDHADMIGLADLLGLELFDRNKYAAKIKVPGSAYYFDGTEYTEEQVAADFRPLQKQITADARALFNDYSGVAPDFDVLSAKDYLDNNAGLIPNGAGYVRTLVENAIRTEYGAEPVNSSALQLLFLVPAVVGKAVDILAYSDEAYNVVGGVGQIPDLIASELLLSGQVKTGKALEAVSDHASGGYQLTFSSGSSAPYDWVIVAVPATKLHDIAFEVTEVDADTTFRDEYLKTIALGDNEKMFAQFSGRPWLDAGEFVQDAWTDLGFSNVWNGTLSQPNHPKAALTFFYGGDEVNNVPGMPKFGSVGNAGNVEVAKLASYVPGIVGAATGDYYRTNWTNYEWTKGAYVNFRPGQLVEWEKYFWIEAPTNNKWRQELRFGRLLFAGEHTSDEYYGFMEGGAQSGRLAAETLLNNL